MEVGDAGRQPWLPDNVGEVGPAGRRTYTRMAREDLDLETLHRREIGFEVDDVRKSR